ncbi:hypothetical protein [Paraflavitalea sp. CAU 1676]|uniref:hypothetical protein n=1 Tax=Paraflavitalea sp. CAU 1676 TaxID=3032598 RepID=UPI0023DA4856|nr:hypothetical protein [Paraflavitalea sp. CAU 1676]MDF2188958.1 hypothetical protein [Paraflavitalea sp. CAU 1676]
MAEKTLTQTAYYAFIASPSLIEDMAGFLDRRTTTISLYLAQNKANNPLTTKKAINYVAQYTKIPKEKLLRVKIKPSKNKPSR